MKPTKFENKLDKQGAFRCFLQQNKIETSSNDGGNSAIMIFESKHKP